MPFPYFDAVRRLLDEAEAANAAAIEQAAEALARCLAAGGVLHTFGTGHGHLLAEELFHRAGGLAAINPLLDAGVMLGDGVQGSTLLERLPGYAEVVLSRYDVRAGDVILIASNSGRNAVPIEMALACKARGLTVVALTSLKHSRSQSARHASSQRLFEVADVVLDNCGEIGDAALTVEGVEGGLCATSTVIGAALLQQWVAETVGRLAAQGITPPLLQSSNVDGADANNAAMVARYRCRVRHL
ncbi:MAG TPA: SIS domain-containing protein [Candidatus Limnocylindrales bacterium]|nr:SIS domain-containing protein [Candidatus Limnocylindrales bacterium]